MIRAVIIEDEIPAVINLKDMLMALNRRIEVIAVLDDVAKSVEWFSRNSCDLVFMDIHLGDDSSFSIFSHITIPAPIIFTTAFEEYAIRAFKLNGIDYLLKPFSLADLEFAIEKFQKQQLSLRLSRELLDLFTAPGKTYRERFMVMSGQRIKTVKTAEISYFKSESRYTRIIAFTGERYLLDESLSTVQDNLDPLVFYRANRQYLVHIDSIKSAVVWSRSRIKLELHPPTEEEVIVSTENTSSIKQWLNR